MATVVLLGNVCELSAGLFDLPFELVPFMLQLMNQVQQPSGKKTAIRENDLQLRV